MIKSDPGNYINREMSWLSFNERVLFEAQEEQNPVLERLKFLSIVSSNFEEFFMIRVAVLKKRKEANLNENPLDFTTPLEQLAMIREKVLRMLAQQYSVFKTRILPELIAKGIYILTETKEIELRREILEPLFEREIKPVLTPLSVGSTHPFPTLITGRLYLAVVLKSKESNRFPEKTTLSFVEVPVNITSRFIPLENQTVFIPVESIIRMFAERLHQGYEVVSSHIVRITRDADFSLQEDGASDLLNEIESTIKKMHRRTVIKIEYEKGFPQDILELIRSKNQAALEDCYEIDGLLNLGDLFQLYEKSERSDLKAEEVTPVYPREFKNQEVFHVIDKNHPLLFHPYHSYDPVDELLTKAAEDPDVLAIKQTLYRTSSDSGVIKALVKAAENGKYVTVIDELRARFDERQNIEWAKKLEEAGAHVIYGVKGLKTHAKAVLIVKKDPVSGGIRRYVHLGTGNYNETTARLYTDFSLFTSDDEIGEDISSLFNLLTGFSYSEEWNTIAVAPINLRERFSALIKRETENAKKGIKARIVAKMNSLSNPDMIRLLYEASMAGVKIKLIIRGICCLVPGVKDLSENIEVISIIGRYLEHSRIFTFHNAGETEYYLSSADWMNRNMDRRVEILFPVAEPENKDFIERILKLQFEDTANCWLLGPDKKYTLVQETGKKKNKSSFDEIQNFIRKDEETRKKNPSIPFVPNRSAE